MEDPQNLEVQAMEKVQDKQHKARVENRINKKPELQLAAIPYGVP